MSEALGLCFVNLIEIFGTTAFRLALAFAGFFGAATLLLFAFIYWTTAIFETHRIDQLIISDAGILANEPTSLMLQLVTTRVTNDFHRVSYAGLFDHTGQRLAGNLPNIPAGLVPDGQAYPVEVTPLGTSGLRTEQVRAVERHLTNGTYLVIGRNSESLEQLQRVVLRALALGVIPAVALSLAAGAFLSWRTQKRVQQVHETAERIMLGHLRERLPTRGGRDEFDRLSISINHMLDEIERLLHELRATGDEIAHDLRTPLTRVRARLERGLTAGVGGQQLEIAVERAIVGLDSALGIVTALLRIREIEAGRRRLGFAGVDLGEIALAIEELYQPIAEEKQVSFEVDRQPVTEVRGDRDLLMEALGNLVDNGIKFTPSGGSVRLSVFESGGRPIVRIADTGPGIEMAERGVVFTRFYRSESSRNHEGSGLGLSLVAAIAKLHSIDIVMNDNNPGSIIELCFKNE
jgi:signal transduction histidine kinase